MTEKKKRKVATWDMVNRLEEEICNVRNENILLKEDKIKLQKEMVGSRQRFEDVIKVLHTEKRSLENDILTLVRIMSGKRDSCYSTLI